MVQLAVRDMDESVKFYTEILGLTVASRGPMEPPVELCILKTNSINIELTHGKEDLDSYPSIGDGVNIGFVVDSVADLKKEFEGKGVKTTEIFHPLPFVKFFYIKDPTGYNIEFTEFVKPEPK